MAILHVDIDKEKDLPLLAEILNRFGLSFEVDDEDLLEEYLKIALVQSESQATRPHHLVMAELRERFTK